MSALSSLLVQDRVLTVTQVEQVLQRQVIIGGDLATNLLELGMVREDVLVKYIAQVVRMPILPLAKLDGVAPEVIALLPADVVGERRIVPVERRGNTLTVAAAGPVAAAVLDEIALRLGVAVAPQLVLEFRLAMAMQRYYGVPMNGRCTALQRKLAPAPTPKAPPAPPVARQRIVSVTSVIPDAKALDDGWGPAPKSSPPPVPQRLVVEPAQPILPAPDTTAKVLLEPVIEPRAHDPRGENTLQMSLPVPIPPAPAAPRPGPGFKHRSSVPPPGTPELLSFTAAATRLEKAADRDSILSILLQFASQAFEFTALLVVQEGALHGRQAAFRGRAPHAIDEVFLPLEKGTVFETVFRTGGYHLGPIGETPADARALEVLHRDLPRSCAIIPIFIKNRVVLMLYGDSGSKGVRTNRIARIAEFGHLVSSAFESLLFKRKYESYSSSSSGPPASPGALLAPLRTGRALVEPATGRKKDLGAFGAPDRASAPKVLVEPAKPPARVSEPPPLPAQRRSRPPAVAATPARSMRYSSVAPEPPKAATAQPAVARTVRVEMQEEIEHLISRLQERGPFDEAAARLLVEIGEDALAEMVKRFPGRLDCDRYQESSRLKRIGQHGPLLRALLLFGARSAQFVAPLMDSFDSEVRFYATFFFSEVRSSDALPFLVKRLFDVDRQVRVLALDIIKGFESQPEYGWAVQEVAAALGNSNSSLEKKRLAAEVLGALRDPAAIRPLAEMLGSVDGLLAERCHKSLVRITFCDFGFSEARWMSWWDANAHLHRIEWALAAVNHRVEEIRNNAMYELRRMVGNAIDWPKGPPDHRMRKEIKRRIQLWWEREGRALNPVVAIERMR